MNLLKFNYRTPTYHHLSTKKIFKVFESQPQGLSKKEAAARLEKFGRNELPETKKFSALILFFHQFKNPLIYILFVALIISFATAHFVDAWIILGVILISGTIGFLQEYKADQALSRLKQMVKYKAKTLRNGQETIVAQEDIIPGDIILLSAGDKIPADARLIEAQNFEVIEAALTGESVPSSKTVDILPPNTPLADRENMIYLGTVVARGKAKAVVVATGHTTELGYIATLVKKTGESKTPLQKQIIHLGKVIGLILVVLNVLIFGLGILVGKPFFEMFLTSVAVMVAAVPEGLFPAMTIILAIGMQRLAKHKGLVRKMLAAETLGSVSVICTDKTGTLTQGEMRVSEIVTQAFKVSNSSTFDFAKNNIERGDGEKFSYTIKPDGEASHIIALKIGLLCNNAIIENPGDELKDWMIVGDSTEKALLLAARSIGLKKEELEEEEPRIAEIPFDSEYKFMATRHKSRGSQLVCAKGAPERILARSSFVDIEGKKVALNATERKEIQEQYEHLTSLGLRVLAVAYKLEDAFSASEKFTIENLDDLVFVGLIALKDPLRPEVKKTISLCQSAGIRPVIVTGDHKLTAMAIVRELGIDVSQENILEGSDLDKISDEKLRGLAKKIIIFARVEPKHKIRIVEALQLNGEVVAMTGDGINDTPALKKADIGIAVGSGADVAKEVADLVLLDNNFETIIEAVRRGRITFNNIRKVVLYLLTDSFSEMVIVGGSIILGLPLPILPVQILWIKLTEDAAPAMSLAFDEMDEDVMKEPPRKKTEPILNHKAKMLIVFYAVIMDSLLLGLFYYFWKTSGNLDYARTITFVGLGIACLFYIYAVRGLKLSIFKLNPFSNKFLVVTTVVGVLMFLAAIYIPFFNDILRTVPLGIKEWIVLGSYGILSIIVYETGKKFTIAKVSK